MNLAQLSIPRSLRRVLCAIVLASVASSAALAQLDVLALDTDRASWDAVVAQAGRAGLSAAIKDYNESALYNQVFLLAGFGAIRFDVAQSLITWTGSVASRFADLSAYRTQLQAAGLELLTHGRAVIGVVLPWRTDAFAGVSARSTRVAQAVQLLTYLSAGATGVGPATPAAKAVPLTIGTITITKAERRNPSVDGSLETLVGAVRQAVPTGVLTALAQLPTQTRDSLTRVAGMLGVPLTPAGDVTLVVESRGGSVAPLGIAVEPTTSPLGLSKVTIPLGQLESFLAGVGAGVYVRLPYTPHEMAVTSEGMALVGATAFHSAGIRGSGAKIAVIDLGFNGLSTAQAQGELPYSVITRDFTGTGVASGISHGTAVAQIVYDVAPDAQLYLIKIANEVDLDNAVTYCISEGVHIINHSLGWFNTNFYDGTGTIADIARRATQAGILWVQAAGNSGQKHYGATFTDGNSDGWHDTDVTFTATAGQQIVLYLTWDAWPATGDDYDLYLFGPTGALVASSTATQGGTEQPVERVTTTAPTSGTYRVRIQKADGATRRLSLFSILQELSPAVSASSIPAPGNAAEVLTVGAIDWPSYTTGPIAAYSSRGPTTDGRTKPDLVAPANVTTGVSFYNPFPGTSAAAPHVAGVAALLKAETPTLTRATLTSRILSFCVAMGAPNSFGAGRLVASPQAAAQPDLVIQSITHSPTNPTVGSTVTFQVTVRNQGAASAGGFTVRLQGSGPSQDGSVGSLGAGASVVRTFTLLLTTSPETFTATADVFNQVAESDETNNTGTRIVTAPSQADLVIQSITHSPTNPTVGSTVTFQVTVRNQGAASAGGFTVRLQGSGPSQDQTVASLAAGASATRTFTLPLTVLSETFTATADVFNQVAESDETNNTLTQLVTALSLADLAIQSITHSPTNPTIGSTVTFQVTVRNQGTASAGSFAVRLQGSGPSQDRSVGSLAAGSQTNLSFTLPLTVSPETFTATADVFNQVSESDETNNTRQVTVIGQTPPPQAQLTTNKASYVQGETVSLTLQNTGVVTVDLPNTAPWAIKNSGGQVVFSPFAAMVITPVAPGESRSWTWDQRDSFGFQVPPGTYTVELQTQNAGTLTATFSVQAPALPDLVIQSFTHSPTNPNLGQTITFTVVVRNQGTASAGSFIVQVQGSGSPSSQSVASLAAGASVTRTFTLPLTTSPETFTATADVFNQVSESDETNNTGTRTVTAPSQPDLIIQSITHSPTNPNLGQTITFTVVVRNQGTASAGSFIVRLQGSGPSQDRSVGSLAAGSQTNLSFTLPLSVSPETFTAAADVFNQVSESDETNNTGTRTVTAPSQPDLVVTNITWTPTNPSVGSTVSFTVTVRNQGAASAGSFVVRLQGVGPSQDRSVGSLAAGSQTNLSFSLPLSTSPETFRATADVFNQVAESDETNNTRQVEVIAPAPPLAFTVATDKSTYTVGEAVRITVTLSRASHVYLVLLDASGRAVLVFPNLRETSPQLPAGTTQIPRLATYTITVSEPVGSEQIVGFAADRAVPFFPTSFGSGFPILHTNGAFFLSQVRSWLNSNVPSGSWAEANAPFTTQLAANVPPTASFTFSPANPLVNQWITFDGRGSSDPDGTITAWAWNFGDGATGTGSQIQKRYSAGGTYTVTLTVTDNRGATGTTTRTVVVGTPNQPPTASFTFTPTNPDPGQNVVFNAAASSDPDGTITAYTWNFGDGATGTGVNVTKAYAAAGTYTVTLTVTDNLGATGTTTRTIQVGTPPPPPPTLPGMPTIDKPGIYVWGDPQNRWHITVAGSPTWTSPRPFRVLLTSNGTFTGLEVTPSSGPAPALSNNNRNLLWEGTIGSGWVDLRFQLTGSGSWIMRLELYIDLDGDGDPVPRTPAEGRAMVFLRSQKVTPPHNPMLFLTPEGVPGPVLPVHNFRIAAGALHSHMVTGTIGDLER